MPNPLDENRVADELGHLDDHNALHHFNNMMMAHFNGTRDTPFAINVQHPDFGAAGNGTTDDAAALNAATDYARRDGTQNEHQRKIWLPRATYAVSEPWIWHQQADIMGSFSTIKALAAFDFTTASASAIGSMPQSVVECHNLNNAPDPTRLAMGRFFSDNVIIDCNAQDGSNGFAGCLQQQSLFRSLRVNNYRNRGIWLTGQQAIFVDTMLIGEASNPGAGHEMTGIYLGAPTQGTSFMWFYGLNIERYKRGVWASDEQVLPGDNNFQDVHFETNAQGGSTYDDDVENPCVAYDLDFGTIRLTGTQHISPGGPGSIFLRAGNTAASPKSYSWDMDRAQINDSGPPNDSIFIKDVGRGIEIRGWGETRLSQQDPPDDGVVRRTGMIMAPNLRDAAWPRYFQQFLGVNGQRMAYSMYHPDQTAGDQLAAVRWEAGSTQFGDLLRVRGKSGNEAFGIVAEGLPELPAFTTPPAATDRKGQFYYDLDDDKVYYSNGTAWVAMT